MEGSAMLKAGMQGILKAATEAIGLWDTLIVVSLTTWAVLIASMVAIIGMCSQGEGWL
jgi:hypothetical protein